MSISQNDTEKRVLVKIKTKEISFVEKEKSGEVESTFLVRVATAQEARLTRRKKMKHVEHSKINFIAKNAQMMSQIFF